MQHGHTRRTHARSSHRLVENLALLLSRALLSDQNIKMQDVTTPLVLLMLTRLISALPVATVRVQFSSPPHSYSHGHDVHTGISSTSSESAVPVTYPLSYLPSQKLESGGYEYARGRSLEVAPLLEAADQGLEDQDIVPTGADLEALISRFADNAPRFFHDFPHQRALLHNIQIRMSQHLPDLRLGSIRPGSPFLRA